MQVNARQTANSEGLNASADEVAGCYFCTRPTIKFVAKIKARRQSNITK
jgi:hypothetical protein